MEKKISKNQKMYPHHFGCSQNHPKPPQWGFLALLGDFGYSQNGGGTFSDFLIFFSPWLYLLITTNVALRTGKGPPDIGMDQLNSCLTFSVG